MRICGNCGAVFDEPLIIAEGRGEFWGSEAYEKMKVCPKCQSTDFDIAKECARCGKIKSWRDMDEDEYMCADCEKEVFDALTEGVRMLVEHFTKTEQVRVRQMMRMGDDRLLDIMEDAVR